MFIEKVLEAGWPGSPYAVTVHSQLFVHLSFWYKFLGATSPAFLFFTLRQGSRRVAQGLAKLVRLALSL